MHPAGAVGNANRLAQTLTGRIQAHHLAVVVTKGPARFQAAVDRQQPITALQGVGGMAAKGRIVEQVSGGRPRRGRPGLKIGGIKTFQRQALVPKDGRPLHGKAAG